MLPSSMMVWKQFSSFHGAVLSKGAAEVTQKLKFLVLTLRLVHSLHQPISPFSDREHVDAPSLGDGIILGRKFIFLMSHSLFLIKQQHSLIAAYKYRNNVQREHSRLYNLASKSVLGISTPEQFICM